MSWFHFYLSFGTHLSSLNIPSGRKELANLLLCSSTASPSGPGDGCLGNQANSLLSALRTGRLRRLPEMGFCWILWCQGLLTLVVLDICCMSRDQEVGGGGGWKKDP